MHIQCLIHAFDLFFLKYTTCRNTCISLLHTISFFFEEVMNTMKTVGRNLILKGNKNLLKDHWSRTVDRLSEV